MDSGQKSILPGVQVWYRRDEYPFSGISDSACLKKWIFTDTKSGILEKSGYLGNLKWIFSGYLTLQLYTKEDIRSGYSRKEDFRSGYLPDIRRGFLEVAFQKEDI